MKPARFSFVVFAPFFLVAALSSDLAGQTAPGKRMTFTITNTTANVCIRETASRVVGGLPITYPIDEADLVDRLLPMIAKYRAARRAVAKAECEGMIAQFADPEVRERYREILPKLLSVEPAEVKGFDAQYDAALARVNLFFRQWEKWSGDLSHLYVWNRAGADAFVKGQRSTFPEVTYEDRLAEGETDLKVSPLYLQQPFGFDLTRAVQGNDPVAGLEPFRLDLPFYYAPGSSADELAESRRELLERLPTTLTQLTRSFGSPAEEGLTEDLLEWAIRTHYFTAAAAATPKGALLIRALTRYYLMAFMKAVGKMEGEAQARMVKKIIHFDVPKDEAERAKLLRDIEALDPFSDEPQSLAAASRALSDAGSRFAGLVLVNSAQGIVNGRPRLFHALREAGRVPKGGFASVADFRRALESTYPGEVEGDLRTVREQVIAAIRDQGVKDNAPRLEAAPVAEAAPELPDRKMQVIEGLTITSPASLTGAVARLAPEWAALLAKARARVGERFGRPSPPVLVADGTLAMLRGHGLQVPREKADQFALQAAVLANAPQMLKVVYSGTAIQVWFKSDLRRLLKEGHVVPGFTYTEEGDKLNFEFTGKGNKVTLSKDKPGLAEVLAGWSIPAYPIVVKDDGVATLTDPDAQAAQIREADIFMRPLMEAAGQISPAQLGIQENSIFRGGLLTPGQSLFSSVSMLVEDELMRTVIGSPDRRWFSEGLAILLALRACEAQLGKDEPGVASRIFASLYDPADVTRRAAEVDLLGWAAQDSEAAGAKDDVGLKQAQAYYATRALMAAIEGRGDGFLKTWLAKIHETSWNRTNAATIIAAYDTLTGKSLRELIKTAAAPSLPPPPVR